MRKFLLCWAFVCAAMPAFATDNHPKPNPPSHSTTNATASADSNASSTSNASGGSIDYFNGGGRAYSLVSIPAFATPLPGGLCPQGDSESFSILWGLVTHAKSTTRTEMECLDKVLAAMRATTVSAPTLPPGPTSPPKEEPPKTKPAAKASKVVGTRSSNGCKGTTKAGLVLASCI